MLALENLHDFLELILLPKYSFFNNKDKEFDLASAISVKSGYNINTPLHHAAMRDNWQCFKILREAGAYMRVFNLRGWTPLQLGSHKSKYFKMLRKELKAKELEDTVACDPI